MRKLADISNVDVPSSDYPKGRIRNKNTAVAPPVLGTPIVEELYGDIVQFFQKLVIDAAITENELPDNVTNTYQLFEAAVKALNGGLLTKVINIGDWNMDTDDDITIPSTLLLNLDFDKLIDYKALILNDSSTIEYNLDEGGEIHKSDNAGKADLSLFRDSGGVFDNTSFDSTPFNRGVVIIRYML